MKNILITGGTGFLGRELIKRIYAKETIPKITVLARNEGKLIYLKLQYPNIKIITGAVEDKCIAEKACKGIDTIYHLAAFKHVGLAETQTYQCWMSNVLGTHNLLKYFKGSLFVAISTDKAAKVQGVYGASKYIMEKLIEERSLVDTDAKYVVPRYGNVIGSTGSVIPKWIDICKNNKEMIITDSKGTRFFFTVSDAIDLIFEAIEKGKNGKPYIKEMKSCFISTLAKVIQMKYGKPSKIAQIGLQPGENKHEYLNDEYNSRDADKFTLDELIEMI